MLDDESSEPENEAKDGTYEPSQPILKSKPKSPMGKKYRGKSKTQQHPKEKGKSEFANEGDTDYDDAPPLKRQRVINSPQSPPKTKSRIASMKTKNSKAAVKSQASEKTKEGGRIRL